MLIYVCYFENDSSGISDLTADILLYCFRRFVSRRGIPSLIVTDNAKTFKNAAKRLVALFEF